MKPKTLLPLLLVVIFLLAPGLQAAQAASAVPGIYTLTDPNTGVSISAEDHGDHQFHFIADPEGRIIVTDLDGSYYYVRKTAQGYQRGPAISNPPPRDASLVLMGDEGLRDKLTSLYVALGSQGSARQGAMRGVPPFVPLPDDYDFPVGDPLHDSVGAIDLSLVHAPEKAATCPLAVIVVQFADIQSCFTPAQWHQRIFDDGIQRYYTTVSNNQFTYEPVVETDGDADGVVTVTLPINAPLYSRARQQNQSIYDDLAAGLYYDNPLRPTAAYAIFGSGSIFAYAIKAAEGFIDFDVYDRNDDGILSPTELAMMVVFSGYEVSSFSPTSKAYQQPGIWAHSGTFNTWRVNEAGDGYLGESTAVLVDHKWVYKYTMMGENTNPSYDYGNPDPAQPAQQAQFGTACHELGHDLGLADLYNTDTTKRLKKDVGFLSVMASGVDGIIPGGTEYGSSPTHFDPHSKIRLGFYEPTVVTQSGLYPLYAAEPANLYNILRINTNDPSVYYLLENRYFVGYDAGLLTGYAMENPGGVVIWRVDDRRVSKYYDSNQLNSEEGDYGVMPAFVDAGAQNPFWGARFRDQGGTAYAIPELPGGVIYCEADAGPVTFVRLALPAVSQQPPPTGDPSQPWLWGLAALAAAAAFLALAGAVKLRKKAR